MPDNAEVKFQRTEDDLVNFKLFVNRTRYVGSFLFLIIAVVMAIAASEAVEPLLQHTPLWEGGSIIRSLTFLAIYFAFFLLFYKVFNRFGNKTKDSLVHEHGHFVSPKTVTISKDSIKETSEYTDSEYNWKAVLEVRRDNGNIMAFIDKKQAIIIPDHAFSDETAADAFYRQMLDYWKAATPEAAATQAA